MKFKELVSEGLLKKRIDDFKTREKIKKSKADAEKYEGYAKLKRANDLLELFKKSKRFDDKSTYIDDDARLYNGEQAHIIFNTKKGDTGSVAVYPDRYEMIIQGYKTDITLGDIGNKPEDVLTIIKALNKKWYEENDPHGDRW